ncbi:MAG TPA: hypothetical protein V6D46_04205 [Coleofasciculaceae cyanobacterium]
MNAIVRGGLLVIAPWIAAIGWQVGPARSGTFAASGAQLEFANFSHPACTASTNAQTLTTTLAIAGSVATEADAIAVFPGADGCGSSDWAYNITSAIGIGQGKTYQGQAISEASLLGIFSIGANDSFGFDVQGLLYALNQISNPYPGRARASSAVSFFLVDLVLGRTIDYLTALVSVDSKPDSGDQNALTHSDGLTVSPTAYSFETGNPFVAEESVNGFAGFFWKTFSQETHLALVEVKHSKVEVSSPEPATLYGLMAIGLSGLLARSNRRDRTVQTKR